MQYFCLDHFFVTNIDHQTSAGVFRLGVGNKSLIFYRLLDNWYWKVNELTSFAATTPGDCVPVSESIYGQIEEGTGFSTILTTYLKICKSLLAFLVVCLVIINEWPPLSHRLL